MRERGIQRWMGAAALVAGMLLGTACGGLPETGGRQPEDPRGNAFAQRGKQGEPLYDVAVQQGKESPAEAHQQPAKLPPYMLTVDRGYNNTIKEIGSSIDPRTPRLEGQSGQSKWDDAGGMMADRYAMFGGAEYPAAAAGLGGEQGEHRRLARGFEEPTRYQAVTPIYLRNR